MLMINKISVITLLILWGTIVLLARRDYLKKRDLRVYPPISFIVPCHNDEKTVSDTIHSIYDSYDHNKIELIVVNDCSTDDSVEVINRLKKKYNFKSINNACNLGKASAVNLACKNAKNKLLCMVDSDVIVNRKAIEGLVARFQNDSRVKAVNCAYNIQNKGWWATMQQMEANMMSLVLLSHNPFSTLYLYGGCLMVDRAAFLKVGGYSKNMLTEDADLAFKLNSHNFFVQHSFFPVSVQVEDKFFKWAKQRTRWVGGTVQCYLKHTQVWIRHLPHLVFLALFSILSIIYVIFLLNSFLFLNAAWKDYELLRQSATLLFSLKLLGFSYGALLFQSILSKTYFIFFSVPFIALRIQRPRELIKILYSIPFTLIYFPVLSVVSILSGIKEMVLFPFKTKDRRAW
ncbi:glycosyltransferase [Candidatus Pacearchaeota archaeon]|nr:glycosyltransferase [Candidatus Pacearchaeota archaeon]